MSIRTIAAWPLLLGSVIVLGGPAAAAHRHVGGTSFYVLSLREANPFSGIADMSGRMVDDTVVLDCSTRRNETQLVLVFTYIDDETRQRTGISIHTETHSDTVDRLEVDSTTYTNEELSNRTVLTAERTADGLDVTVEEPEPEMLHLDEMVVFPSGLVDSAMAAIAADETMFEHLDYDGVGGVDDVKRVTGEIGPESTEPVEQLDRGLAARIGLEGLRHWPVTYSFFPEGADAAEYVLVTQLFENGFILDLAYVFPNYAADLELVDFQPPREMGCAEAMSDEQ